MNILYIINKFINMLMKFINKELNIFLKDYIISRYILIQLNNYRSSIYFLMIIIINIIINIFNIKQFINSFNINEN